MKTFTIDQARSAALSGGILSANLLPDGSMFTLEFETRNGPATLIAAVSKKVRRFANPVKAFEIVRDLGLEGGHFSVVQWRPQERELDRIARPDKSRALKAAHQAAELKRVLDDRIALADSPGAIWHDAQDVFDDLESRNAR
jgi:hypothetical protein